MRLFVLANLLMAASILLIVASVCYNLDQGELNKNSPASINIEIARYEWKRLWKRVETEQPERAKAETDN